ncbi:hypothetical protein C0992_003514 [Termitomyces sp. T32_za158]|nr:hypothetical protein C0992_003514 [Termitomyces sp. T32_za158]
MRSLYPEFALNNIRIATIHPFFADAKIAPIPIKVLLAGIPLALVPRAAGAIIHAVTNPDPETNGVAFLRTMMVPSMVPREEFKLGVYKMIDERSNRLLSTAAGAIYYARLLRKRCCWRRSRQVGWEQQELILQSVRKYVSL